MKLSRKIFQEKGTDGFEHKYTQVQDNIVFFPCLWYIVSYEELVNLNHKNENSNLFQRKEIYKTISYKIFYFSCKKVCTK